MTDCRNIQEILSAYLEGAVSPDEERLVRSHLASCLRCSAVLEDLKKTAELVKGLEEVEPPPWLAQKIMAHVRDEAEKEEAGFFKRIFYPLRIKVPIQALATLLIVVVVFYVYKSNEPEFEAPRYPVKTEQGTPQKAVPEPPSAPAAGSPAPKKGTTDRAVRGPSPAGPPAPAVAPRSADSPTAAAPAPTFDSTGSSRHEPDRALLLRSAEKAEAERQTAEKQKEVQKAEAPARLQGSRARVFTAPQTAKRAAKESSPLDVTLTVVDVKAAAREVEEVLRQNGAWNVARESHDGSESVTGELQREKAGPLVERLDEIGDAEPLSPSLPPGNIAIRIKVVPETE